MCAHREQLGSIEDIVEIYFVRIFWLVLELYCMLFDHPFTDEINLIDSSIISVIFEVASSFVLTVKINRKDWRQFA